MTSAVAETQVLGDPTNAQGFKTAGGVRVTPGYVVWTAHTTSDITAPAAQALSLAGRDFLTFKNICFFGGTTTCVLATTTTSTDCKFQDCFFSTWGTGGAINVTGGANVVLNWTISRCIVVGMSTHFTITITTSTTGSDWDVNFLIEDCLVITFNSANLNINITAGGANSVKGNGIRIRGCTILGGGSAVSANNAGLSTTYPSTVTNCILRSSGTLLTGTAGGALTEDYNILLTFGTLRSNVSAGAHSKDNIYCPMIELGQGFMWGLPFLRRPPFEPMVGSPLLGFGDDGNLSAYDLFNRRRPAGGASASKAVGALERGNTFATDPSPIGGGGSAIKATGPAYSSFLVPVPASAQRTISVKVRRDSGYSGTNPQLSAFPNV
jgi:hypothetical protein